MATLKVTGIVPDGTTNTSFRAWGQNVSNLIANTTGMVRQTVTGNINWATVATSTTEAGFEIFAFNDTLQATAPVFFRLGYGGGNGSAARPALYLTLGAGLSDNVISTVGGAAPTTGNTIVDYNNSSPNANLISWCSGNASSLMLTLWMTSMNATFSSTGGPPYDGSTGIPLILSIERTKNADGTDNAEGVWIVLINNSGRAWKQVYWSGTTGMGTTTYEGSLGAMIPAVNTTAMPNNGDNKFPGQIGFFPNYFTKAGGIFSGPSLNIVHTNSDGPGNPSSQIQLGYGFGLHNLGQVITVPMYGANHTYLSWGANQTGGNRFGSVNGGSSFLTRYE